VAALLALRGSRLAGPALRVPRVHLLLQRLRPLPFVACCIHPLAHCMRVCAGSNVSILQNVTLGGAPS
jgi:hypothetical protein